MMNLEVATFSRHADVQVIARYDDAREDVAGQIAKMLAAGGVRRWNSLKMNQLIRMFMT
jgi:hypothetical protein